MSRSAAASPGAHAIRDPHAAVGAARKGKAGEGLEPGLDRRNPVEMADVVLGHGVAVSPYAGEHGPACDAEEGRHVIVGKTGQHPVVLREEITLQRPSDEHAEEGEAVGARPGYFTLEKVHARVARRSTRGTTNPKPSRGCRTAARE